MDPKRTVTITDFLTERQIQEAIKLKDAKRICKDIIEPNLDTINRKLGQENNPMYLAYVVEYVISLGQPRN